MLAAPSLLPERPIESTNLGIKPVGGPSGQQGQQRLRAPSRENRQSSTDARDLAGESG
jgi:hypothetical protein